MSSSNLNNFQLTLSQPLEIILALSLALMMFSVALGLKPIHFSFIKTQPRIYLTGVIAQIVGLPLLTLGLCYLFNPEPSIALGMILVACCPGGNVSNLLVLLARGNTALSVSLTATSSFSAAFITPAAILFWSSNYPPTNELLNSIDFDAIKFLIQTSVLLVLPLIVGMSIVHYFNALAQRLQKPLVIISGSSLLLVILITFSNHFEFFISVGIAVIALLILHNACAFILGYVCARLIKAPTDHRITLTYEVGIQNAGLAIVILLTQLDGLGGAAMVTGFWGSWHIIAGLVLAVAFRLKHKQRNTLCSTLK